MTEQAVLWITDEMGRRLFPVARNAAKALKDDIELPSDGGRWPACNVLTTMRVATNR